MKPFRTKQPLAKQQSVSRSISVCAVLEYVCAHLCLCVSLPLALARPLPPLWLRCKKKRQTARPQQRQLTALICFDRGSIITTLDAHLQHGAPSMGGHNDCGALERGTEIFLKLLGPSTASVCSWEYCKWRGNM